MGERRVVERGSPRGRTCRQHDRRETLGPDGVSPPLLLGLMRWPRRRGRSILVVLPPCCRNDFRTEGRLGPADGEQLSLLHDVPRYAGAFAPKPVDAVLALVVRGVVRKRVLRHEKDDEPLERPP